ncbi:MAG: cation transporter [Planctomycetales bacterium]
MKSILNLTVAGLVLALASAASQAGEVKVSGVHICCGMCVKAIDAALKDVQGVSAAKGDAKTKVVVFQAADDKGAEAGVKALAAAGFYGEAKHGDVVVAFPASGAKADAKADTIVLTGVHLCCGGCVTASTKAVKEVAGVTDAKGDPKAKTVTVTGSSVEVAKAVEALNKAGFYAKAGGDTK